MSAYTGLAMGAANNSGLWDAYNTYQNDYYHKPQDTRGDVQNWNQFSGITDFMNKHANDPGYGGALNAGMFNLPKNQWESYLQGHNQGYTHLNSSNPANAGQFRYFDPQNDQPNQRFNNVNTSPSAGIGGGGTNPLVTPNTQVAYSSQSSQPAPANNGYQYTPPATSPTPINTAPTMTTPGTQAFSSATSPMQSGVSQPIQAKVNKPTSFNRHQMGGFRRFRSR